MIVSLTLVALTVTLLYVYKFDRKRKKGEPALVASPIPYVGVALDLGRNPFGYLKSLQNKHGDVFTYVMAGWNIHTFMDPRDVKNLERCRHLDHKEILGDFVTCMVGDPHSLYNIPEQKKSLFQPSKVLRSLLCSLGLKSKERIRVENEIASEKLKDSTAVSKAVSYSLEGNLRGSMQLGNLSTSCTSVVIKALTRSLRQGDVAKPIKLYEFCKEIIFDVTFNLLFGTLENQQERDLETAKFYEQFAIYFKRSALLLDRIPIHFLPEVKRAREKLFELFKGLDWSKRISVSHMISDVVNANPKLEFLDQRSRHLTVILWAAFANTTPALFWVFYYFLNHPEAQREVLTEYRTMLSNKMKRKKKKDIKDWTDIHNISLLDKKDLDKLVVLDACLKEVMRLCGSSLSFRKALKDTTINTYSGRTFNIRKGDYTSFFAPITHRDEDIYRNPEEFQYDRFLVNEYDSFSDSSSSLGACSNITTATRNNIIDEKLLIDLPEFSTKNGLLCPPENNYIPSVTTRRRARNRFYKEGKRLQSSRAVMTFGYGASKCPGRHIALVEIKLILLGWLNKFDVTIEQGVPEFDLTHLGFGVMPPDRDINIYCKPKI